MQKVRTFFQLFFLSSSGGANPIPTTVSIMPCNHADDAVDVALNIVAEGLCQKRRENFELRQEQARLEEDNARLKSQNTQLSLKSPLILSYITLYVH